MSYGRILRVVFIVLLCMFSCLSSALESAANFVDMLEARIVVESWLALNEGPLSDEMGKDIREIVHYRGGKHGEPGFYIFFLEPNGWIAVPADNRLEAIVAFGVGVMTPKSFANSPLTYILKVDLPPRPQQMAGFSASPRENEGARNPRQMRWDYLKNEQSNFAALSAAASRTGRRLGIDNDVVVEPLLGKNNWDQDSIRGIHFYNYSVNWDGNDYDKYVAGCVPVSLGQIMRRLEHPKVSLSSTASFEINLDGVPAPDKKSFIRTDEPYNWENMPVFINEKHSRALALTEEEDKEDALMNNPFYSGITSQDVADILSYRDEISALLHDIGISLNSSYNSASVPGTDPIKDPSTGSRLSKVPNVLKDYFNYGNAVHNFLSRERDGNGNVIDYSKRLVRAIEYGASD